MNDNKKGFILYNNYQEYFALLSREERGDLITAIFAYANLGEEPNLGGAALMAFTMIKSQLDRDNAKYERRCERNRQNGMKGGRPAVNTEAKDESGTPEPDPDNKTTTQKTHSVNSEPNQSEAKPNNPIQTIDKDTDKDNDTDISKDIVNNPSVVPLAGGSDRVEVFCIDEVFDLAYQRYPRGSGKTRGKQIYIQYLNGRRVKGQPTIKYNHHQLSIAIQNYAEEVTGRAEDKIKMFDTFMGSHVIDCVERTAEAYSEAMRDKYGEKWQEIKFMYR